MEMEFWMLESEVKNAKNALPTSHLSLKEEEALRFMVGNFCNN
jgi:hypothetical protein